MVFDNRFFNFVVIEQFLSDPSILASDQISLLKRPNGPKSDIFQIANGRRYNV